MAMHFQVKGVGTIIKVGGGGLGNNGVQSARKILPYYIQNFKICIKISILLLNIAMFVHFFAYATL